ncbi:DUF4173 domain-containing protein [Rhodococcus sp. Q]|uniref:DUF4153 domain-containing protein n=1 Tax=Rhodococcus sp. Q TaxID=2502252 RepID=UPI0010F7C4E2|nr:DUF4173 domain-containing protein [Rhodococcus sp. Q]
MTTPKTVTAPKAAPASRTSRWGARVWRPDRTSIAPTATVTAAAVAGLLAALTLRAGTPSVAYPLAGIAVMGTVVAAGRPRPTRGHLVAAVTVLALLSVAAIRGAGWLVTLCVIAGWTVGSAALLGVRTWTGIGLAPAAPWLTPGRVTGWLRRRRRRGSGSAIRAGRIAGVVTITVVLIGVFGLLFAGADPEFGRLLGGAVPTVRTDDLSAAIVTGAAIAAVSLASAYLWRRPIRLDALAPAAGRRVPSWEWAVPVLALDLLFAGFVAVQVRVMFAGDGHVLSTPDLTYADYARQGFWQLCAVTALTLIVIAVAVRRIDLVVRRDRMLARLLLGSLCVLSIVVVASALHRMSLYENAFGYTRLRLAVWVVELWFGTVFAVLLIAGIRMRGALLPRIVLGSAVTALLAFAAVNPDGYIADRNVDRYDRTGEIDVTYLRSLSVDAVPALDRLPEPLRSCTLIATSTTPDAWYEFNAGRARARDILQERPADPLAVCVSPSAGW